MIFYHSHFPIKLNHPETEIRRPNTVLCCLLCRVAARYFVWFIAILTWWLWGIIVPHLSAAEPYQPKRLDPMSQPWRWRHIAELDGRGLRCMAGAPDNSMWFGVEHGALHYDGLKWHMHSVNQGLEVPSIESIVCTPKGVVYAASLSEIYRFRDGIWEKLLTSPFACQIQLFISPLGEVWAGWDQGFFRFNGDQAEWITGSAVRFRKGEGALSGIKRVSIPDELGFSENFDIDAIYEDGDRKLWLSVNQTHLIRWDTTQPASDPAAWLRKTCPEVVHIFKATGDKAWIAQFSRAQNLYRFRLRTGKKHRLNLKNFGGETFTESFHSDRDGTIWLCGRKYLQALPPSTSPIPYNDILAAEAVQWRIYNHPDRSEALICLSEASDGSLWTGKRMGQVYRVDRSDANWSGFQNLNFQCEGAGRKWFLTREGYVVSQTPEKSWLRYDQSDGLMSDPTAMTATRSGQIWASGSHNGTAATAVFSDETWTRHLHPSLGWTVDYRSLYETSRGTLLIQANNEPPSGGTSLIEISPSPQFKPKFTAIENFPYGINIAEGINGELWIGGGYLHVFDDGKTLNRTQEIFSPTAWIDAIDSSPTGAIWISVGGKGVFRFLDSKWTHFTTADGLGDMMASALQCMDDGTIWASTPRGISRFDGRSWTPQIFGQDFPGLIRESGTLKTAKNGDLWVNYSSRDWFFRAKSKESFDFDSLPNFRTIRYHPNTELIPQTLITMGVDQVSQPGNVLLGWEGTVAWSETAQGSLEYSWRIDEGDWSHFSADTNHTFLALSPGRHRFEVRARDQHFNIDPTPATLDFTVVAPVWRQPWSILMLLTALGLLGALIYVLVRQHEREMVAREKQKVEIERIKLNMFTNISHELRTPLSVMASPIERAIKSMDDGKLKKYLGIALRNVREMQHLVEQILDLRKIQDGHFEFELTEIDLVQHTRKILESFTILAETKEQFLTFETELESLPVVFDRHTLLRILGNLIGNSIKFTPAKGKIKVRLSRDQSTVNPEEIIARFEVEDNGVGIGGDQMEHIFKSHYSTTSTLPESDKVRNSGVGLTLTRELIDRLGGRIDVESPVDKKSTDQPGTKFMVEWPLEKR